MRSVLDACVLYPEATRRLLIAAAGLGHLVPVWSARILGEWERAAGREGPAAAALVRAEAERLRAAFPGAEVDPAPLPGVVLPDPDDLHVLGACVAAGAGFLVTRNRRDFPRGTLARHAVSLLEPDALLRGLAAEDARLAVAAREVAAALAPGQAPRAVIKRAGLPRLARLLE